jgi:hypothetical protein
MRFVAGSQLVRRSETELDALLLAFNQALARSRPFSEEWKDARLSVDNILSERRRRIACPGPGF